jgi:hypothetical protein
MDGNSDRAAEFLLRARRPEKYAGVVAGNESADPQAIAQQTISLLREAMLAARQAQVGQLSAGESGPGGPVVETTAIIGDTHE